MSRIALKLTEEVFAAINQMFNNDVPSDVFGDENYVLVTVVNANPVEMNMKFMSEDDLIEELQSDSDIAIIAL